MAPIVEIVEAAEREVLAHTIESTRGLRAYLCQHGGKERLSLLQEEAVRRGLYRYMGECYAKELEATLCRTRRCIALGRIKTDDELKFYLTDLAATLVRYRDLAPAINDLLIQARQTGVYSLLAHIRRAAGITLNERPHDRNPDTQDLIRSATQAGR
jgi:hypothetical protein